MWNYVQLFKKYFCCVVSLVSLTPEKVYVCTCSDFKVVWMVATKDLKDEVIFWTGRNFNLSILLVRSYIWR